MSAIQLASAGHGIPVIEDCAQAQGATIDGQPVGSWGEIACFSFYPTKNLGALGDGGAVVTNNAALGDRVRTLRTYGWTKPQFAALEGGRCSRLDEIQAAILSIKLRALAVNVDYRRAAADRYRAHLAQLPVILPTERSGCRHSYHLFVIRAEARDALADHMRSNGIGVGRHYPWPVHQQPGLLSGARIPEPLLVTEGVATEILSLPMFTTISSAQIDRVVEAVQKFYCK
jgi:dTDP-4-amino-4,6-dideoxygalactose transaminase